VNFDMNNGWVEYLFRFAQGIYSGLTITGWAALIGLFFLLLFLIRRKDAPRHEKLPAQKPLRPAAGSVLAAALAPTASLPGSGKKGPPPPPVEELRDSFPELDILGLIGQGGMGAVYRVRRRLDGAVLALKVVAGDGPNGDEFAARFLREADVLHRLDHPNIVAIREHGRSGRWCWLLMDLVDGANLRQVMATGSMSPEQALALVSPICAALQYAHDQGVVHRDVKPENILIDQQGRPHVADFGLAKLVEAPTGEALTVTGAALGTYHYMAPEQVERSRAVDHRADIYALGVVIYELLTGRLPLGRFELPSQTVQVDVRVDEVVLRALERNPERRWQKASQVQKAMADIEKSSAPVHSSVSDTTIRPWGMEEHTFCTLMHLSQFAGYTIPLAGWILPIVMWLTARDKSAHIEVHGRVVINWILSTLIYGIVFALLCFVLIGIPLLWALGICCLIFPIIGAIRASEGKLWKYPLSIEFLSAQHSADQASTSGKPIGCLGLGCLILALILLVLLILCGGAYLMAQAQPHVFRINI
jgi:uncharacterized Tic20 family protein